MEKIIKGDLILADCNYLQQVEKVEDNKIYTCDSRFPYDLEDIKEIHRRNDKPFVGYYPIYVKGKGGNQNDS